VELSEATAYVEGCIHDALAPCAWACPFHLDIRTFLKKAAKGRMPAACRDYRTAVIFPAVVSTLCTAPCMEKCQRRELGDAPLNLLELERAVVRLAGPQEPVAYPITPKEQRIAVLGAGCAGLAFALCMAQKKYKVTVFEREKEPGGLLRVHPDYPIFLEDFRQQFSGETVDFRYETPVNSLETLADFDLICVATGDAGEDFGLLDSWDSTNFTTNNPRVLLCGGLCGVTTIQAIADAQKLSRLAESILQTGRAIDTEPSGPCPEASLIPENAVSAPAVPLPPDGYGKDEVKAEAGRCFQCKCDKCLRECALLDKYNKPPLQMAMEVLADSGPHFLASRTMTRQVYSCNECSRCAASCPEQLDIGELFHFSKVARVKDGIEPSALHDFWMRELEFTRREAFLTAGPDGGCEYAFFPGCRLSASLPEQTLRSAAWLRDNFRAGVILGCCGASAWWAGEETVMEENSAQLREAWEKLGRPTLVLGCASCAKMLARVLPEIPTLPMYSLMEQKGLTPAGQISGDYCVFDPCAARENVQFRQSVRGIATQSGCALTELPEREQGWCCGWGGHVRTANPALYESNADRRAAAGELPYLVYCANCREVFRERNKECLHVLELLFGTCDRDWTIQEKRDNQLMVKGRLMQEMQGQEYCPPVHEWDGLKLHITPEIRRDMEEQLISDSDIKECIYISVHSGERFTDGEGAYLSCLRRRIMTYWVEYREAGDVYEIVSAYCHRMQFDTEEKS